VSSSVGGTVGRKIQFFTESGVVHQKMIEKRFSESELVNKSSFSVDSN
jgi:hypothetical protein